MDIIANIGKLKSGQDIILLQKADHYEFVLATGYDKETQSWGSGTYLYDIEDLAKAILYTEQTIGYDRMCEIASKAIDGLRENDEDEAQAYCREEIDMDYDERKFFGLTESEDE